MARSTSIFVLTVAVFGASELLAHEFWIEPPAAAEASEPIELTLNVGDGFAGETYPRNNELIERFELIGPNRTRAIPGVHGRTPAGRIRLDEGGVHVAVYRSSPSETRIEADVFEAYLLDEGLEHVASERVRRGEQGAPGHELFSRCAKSIWRHGEGPDHAATRTVGLRFEIVPSVNPLDALPGTTLEVIVLLDGAPASGVLLHSFRRGTDGPVQRVRTDADGRAAMKLDRRGTWMLAGVHMEPAPASAAADWSSVWTSLTFSL